MTEEIEIEVEVEVSDPDLERQWDAWLSANIQPVDWPIPWDLGQFAKQLCIDLQRIQKWSTDLDYRPKRRWRRHK
jgi:hypothetical protein